MASRALQIDPEHSESVQEKIAVLAYQFWLERGCPIGSDQEDWFRAERELAGSKRAEDEDFEISTELAIVPAEETDSPVLRFPVRSELFQAPHGRLLRRA